MRGSIKQLPTKLIEEAEEKYFIKFDQTILRFLPYLHYLAINQQRLDPSKINAEEREIYHRVANELGVINGGASAPIEFVDKRFYDFVCDCLYYAYNQS